MKAAADEMEYSSELLYDALIESTDDFIYMCNPKTGMFRYPAALVDMFGLPGEVVKHPLTYWKAHCASGKTGNVFINPIWKLFPER